MDAALQTANICNKATTPHHIHATNFRHMCHFTIYWNPGPKMFGLGFGVMPVHTCTSITPKPYHQLGHPFRFLLCLVRVLVT